MERTNSMLGTHAPAKFSPNIPPQLIVVIDTEEEFDWNAPADRKETGVSAMAHIDRVQSIFDHYGLKPCYVVDYPVVNQAEGAQPLKEIVLSGRCEIGAHLHPWVNPPFDEALIPENTFPGNLPYDLEKAKLQRLTDKITEVFGKRPSVYKAGRYGVGPRTTEILEDLGYEIDVSLCPPVNYAPIGGPDFSHCHAEPFWFGRDSQLLEIPVTGGFVGLAGHWSLPVYNFGQKLRRLKMPAILSRLSVVDRLMLSPEGFSTSEHIKLTRHLFERGVRTFTWSFHSPSVVPGHTDYVQNDQQLETFLDMFRRYFDFFFNDLGGVASTPTAIRDSLRESK